MKYIIVISFILMWAVAVYVAVKTIRYGKTRVRLIEPEPRNVAIGPEAKGDVVVNWGGIYSNASNASGYSNTYVGCLAPTQPFHVRAATDNTIFGPPVDDGPGVENSRLGWSDDDNGKVGR